MKSKTYIITLLLCSTFACQAQSNDPYWCKYTNTCDVDNTQRTESVPQQDPYSTPVYNDGGPTGFTGNNGAPYYDPYNTPSEDMVMPYYGYPIIGSENFQNTTNSDFNIKK